MRLLTSASIGVLSLLLGIPAVNAQDDAKPRQEEPKAEPAQPESAKPAQQNNNLRQHEEMNQDQDKQTKQDEDKMKQEENKPAKEEKPSKEEKQQQKEQEKAAREGNKPQEHAEGSRPAGQGGHIPDDKFRQHFGRQHTVVINRPTIVEGQPRFQYSGYWFVISDPWPVDWAYTDQCYIDYVDGEYFLFDLLHPGVRIALFVVM
jgi:hypothetical protein